MTSHEKEMNKTFYRPEARPLAGLTNEELQLIFDLRAAKVKLDPKGFWDDNRLVSWFDMPKLLESLYEVMLEIQSRYPQREIYQGMKGILPILEAGRKALPCGLKELASSVPDVEMGIRARKKS